jgi:L-asparaginase/Glu-tRNA(Gln) amidotransferase subunit D
VLGKPSASLTLEDLALIAASALEATRTADGVVITHGAAGTAIRAAFELF